MKDTNEEVKAYLDSRINPGSSNKVVLRALNRIERMGIGVEDNSEESGYPNYSIRTEEGRVRVYKHHRDGWQVQPWKSVTFSYSGVPTFFGHGLMKGVKA